MPDIINSSFDPRLPFPLDVRQQVQDMNALYAIPNTSRWEGMIVYVRSSETLYILKGGIDNSFWLALQFNGGGGLLPNGIVIYGEAQQAGNDILLNDAWVWRIDQVDYQSSDDVISITPAAAGNLRVDIIVGDNLGNFVKVVGTEVASPGPAIEPNIPADTVPLLRVDVNDTGITAITEFVLSAFVRYDINDQGLTPTFRQNARTNIQAVSKDTDDTKTGKLGIGVNSGQLDTNSLIVKSQTTDQNEFFTLLYEDDSVAVQQFNDGRFVIKNKSGSARQALDVDGSIGGSKAAFFKGVGPTISTSPAVVEIINTTGDRRTLGIKDGSNVENISLYSGGTIFHGRSDDSTKSIRRDENYLTYPVSISGTGKLNDVALANGVGAIKCSSGVTEVSGIDPSGDTKELLIWSDNPDGITLPAEDVLSIATNRFFREVNVPYQTWVRVVYEASLSRWVNANTGELQETDARYFEVVDDVLTLKYILPDIAALQAFVRGPAVIAYVSDPLRGGYFNYVTEGDFVGSADFGISFPAQDGGYWVRDFEGEVNVQWFGAVGDGVTDDGDAIRAAVDSIELTGGTIFFPTTDDFYWMNDNIVQLHSNTILTSNMAKIKSKAGWGPFRLTYKENVIIEKLRFDGSLLDPGVPESNPTSIFIGFINSDHATVRDCIFENMTNCAIYSAGSHFGLVENCFFYNIRRDISGMIPVCVRPELNTYPARGSENWIIRGCRFINPDKIPSSIGAITANGNEDGTSPARNILIDGCYFEKMGRHEDLLGDPVISGPRGDVDVYNDVFDITIQNCVSVDSMYTFAKINDSQYVKIINNKVYNCGERLVNLSQRYSITQNKDVEIRGNVQIGGSGIRITHYDLWGTRFFITDNVLVLNSTDNTNWGIRVANIDSFATITGNIIKGSRIEISVRDTNDEGANVVCEGNTVDVETEDNVITDAHGIECYNLTGELNYPIFKLDKNLVRNIPVGKSALFFGDNTSAIVDNTTYEDILGTKIGTFSGTGPLYINGIQEVDADDADLSLMPSGMRAINVNTGTELIKLQDGTVLERPKSIDKLVYSNTFNTNVAEIFIDIPSGYTRYRMIIEQLRLEGDYALLMQASEDGGLNYLATGYDCTLVRTSSNLANDVFDSLNTPNTSQFRLSTFNSNSSRFLNQYEINFYTDGNFKIRSEAVTFDGTDDTWRESATGMVVSTNPINQLRIYPIANNLRFGSTPCVIKMYAYL